MHCIVALCRWAWLVLVVLCCINVRGEKDADAATFFWVQRGAIQLANGFGVQALASRRPAH